MIQYHKTAFGLGTLFRIHGSAAYRACFSGFFAVCVFALIRSFWDSSGSDTNPDEIPHPYAVGILISALTFLLVFRAQAAYARYWEANSAVFHMMSKWMDATSHTAIYHLQCDHYNHIKPPSFFEYPELNAHFLSREREDRQTQLSTESYMDVGRISERATTKSIESVQDARFQNNFKKRNGSSSSHKRHSSEGSDMSGPKASDRLDKLPNPLEGMPKLDGNFGALFDDEKATYFDPKKPFQRSIPKGGFASFQGGRTAPLFLQELAHLASLMCGVALATLRNDIEGSESPLDIYLPGADWPKVNPLEGDSTFESSRWNKFMNFLGMGRSDEERTRYNASRPMPIIGGVSEGEIRFLQMSRGPYAKTQLCWQWLSEFIVREHLAGSTGNVGPPIISRIIQFLGDGMIHYNHARKIMFVPFPFPHAQLSAIYILVAIPAVSFLMDQYTDEAWVGCVLTFLTITCLSGIHEVARELENPFRNIPNEIPLVTLQAQFNEALITMYAGYHPDHFWRAEAEYYLNVCKGRPSLQDSKLGKGSTAEAVPQTPPRPRFSHTVVASKGEWSPRMENQLTPRKEIQLTPQTENHINSKDNGLDMPQLPEETPATPSPSMEAQIQMLVKKLEKQGKELEELRRKTNGDGAPKVLNDEKKVQQ